MNNASDLIVWSPGVTLDQIEKQVILKAYRFYRGNATQAAIALGINEKTIRNKLERYDDEGKRQRDAEQREVAERQAQLNRARGVIPESLTDGGGPRVYGSSSGIQSQPAVETPAEHELPVSERQEVQEVLQAEPVASDQDRGRAEVRKSDARTKSRVSHKGKRSRAKGRR